MGGIVSLDAISSIGSIANIATMAVLATLTGLHANMSHMTRVRSVVSTTNRNLSIALGFLRASISGRASIISVHSLVASVKSGISIASIARGSGMASALVTIISFQRLFVVIARKVETVRAARTWRACGIRNATLMSNIQISAV
jgi:hypothetical protein